MKNTIETQLNQPCQIPAMAEVNAILAEYVELHEFMEDMAEEGELVGMNQAARAR